MKVLFCGDVVGKSGRQVLSAVLPKLKKKLTPDFIIVNGENAAHGFGLTPKLFQGFMKMGVDVVTMGNHTFDKADINNLLDSEPRLVRPMNYPENTIGHGFCVVEKGAIRVCVVQLLGKVFMRPVEEPFPIIEAFIKAHQKDYDVLIVDFHAEATAEKVGMGYFLDGRAALVLGTHTHTPTADARIL
ncbi:MAG: TIGR00282 family metallophosphoesterase, partial [Pseudomonadota bacterium]|nr:TIGR00282 family metallophosphoesterase [Pseudomonadota bacterium]